MGVNYGIDIRAILIYAEVQIRLYRWWQNTRKGIQIKIENTQVISGHIPVALPRGGYHEDIPLSNPQGYISTSPSERPKKSPI